MGDEYWRVCGRCLEVVLNVVEEDCAEGVWRIVLKVLRGCAKHGAWRFVPKA